MSRRTGPGQLISLDTHPVKHTSPMYLLLKLAALLILMAIVFFLCLASWAVADTPQSGELLSSVDAGENWQPVSQVSTKVRFKISGMIAQVTLMQSFKNTESDWVEAKYQFPLPDTAAVKSMDMVVGERIIRGRVREKQLAAKIFNQAKAAGKKAGLVSQQSPNMFTSRVANIGPGEVIKIELVYVQRLTFEAGQFSLRFPMTITPRYLPGAPLPVGEWATSSKIAADAADIHVELDGVLDMGMPLVHISSPSHELALTRKGQSYRFSLQSRVAPMNRDFVLQWRAQTGLEPRAAAFREKVGDSEYVLLMVVPPGSSRVQTLKRRVVFVIDTSGSMGGTSIEQARSSLDTAISELRNGEQFNVIEFNSYARALFATPVEVNASSQKRARRFVASLQANGGTEMHGALELAMSQAGNIAAKKTDRYLEQIVFITDGAVGNEAQLFELIKSQLGNARLFTVGIGSAPNSWFMRKAAALGGGVHVYLAFES